MHFEIQWHVSQQTSWLHVLMQLFWFPLFFMVYLASIVSTHATNTPPPLTIAVASNFYAPLKKICTNFTQETGIQVRLSNGSTGNLRRQIQHGAPYDLFFSADSKRPIQLEKKKLTDLRFSYAFGKLAVWSIKPDSITPDLNTLDINNANLRFLAIANPKVAPYGIAAKEVLQHFNLYQPLKQEKKLVTGENIGKTFHSGFQQCKTDWVIRMDLDYFFHENDFAKLKQILKKNIDSPSVAFPQYQFFTPDRFQVKTKLCIALNKKYFPSIKIANLDYDFSNMFTNKKTIEKYTEDTYTLREITSKVIDNTQEDLLIETISLSHKTNFNNEIGWSDHSCSPAIIYRAINKFDAKL